MVQKASDKARQ